MGMKRLGKAQDVITVLRKSSLFKMYIYKMTSLFDDAIGFIFSDFYQDFTEENFFYLVH